MSFLWLLLTFLHTFISANAAATNVVQINRNPITLELSRYVNATGMRNLVAHDRARAKALRQRVAWRGFKETQSLTHEPIVDVAISYVALVGVGNPPTTYRLIVDTGSSNTWIGSGIPYAPTSTSTKTGTVSVAYGLGFFTGTEYTDQVTLTPELVIPNQSIGVATFASFKDVDGILGLGPVGLTKGTCYPNINSTVPTVTDNLYANCAIRNNEIGVYFRPSKSAVEINGEISWGGVNSLKIINPVTYIPITTTHPASEYWGIDQSIHYGSPPTATTTTPILPISAGIVDTGTTLILIASDAYIKYAHATRASYDTHVGLLSISPAQYANLKSLYFTTRAGETFELIPNAQIWPRSLNTQIGGTSDAIYLIVADLGSPSGHGFDFINGFCFLQRYYSVYDTANKQLGFAVTRHTRDETN